jgi:hypothetical protein
MQSKPLVWGIGILAVLILAVAGYSLFAAQTGSGLEVVDGQNTATTTGSTTGTGSTSGSTTTTTTSTTTSTTTTSTGNGVNMAALSAKMANTLYTSEKFYLIDNSVILAVRTGAAADASYSHVLLDKNLNQLCIVSDSIAGPRESCTDSSKKAMFDIAVANLDKANLGLTGHTVVVLH